MSGNPMKDSHDLLPAVEKKQKVDEAAKEANEGKGDLNDKQKTIMEHLKKGGRSGITGDFGKPMFFDSMENLKAIPPVKKEYKGTGEIPLPKLPDQAGTIRDTNPKPGEPIAYNPTKNPELKPNLEPTPAPTGDAGFTPKFPEKPGHIPAVEFPKIPEKPDHIPAVEFPKIPEKPGHIPAVEFPKFPEKPGKAGEIVLPKEDPGFIPQLPPSDNPLRDIGDPGFTPQPIDKPDFNIPENDRGFKPQPVDRPDYNIPENDPGFKPQPAGKPDYNIPENDPGFKPQPVDKPDFNIPENDPGFNPEGTRPAIFDSFARRSADSGKHERLEQEHGERTGNKVAYDQDGRIKEVHYSRRGNQEHGTDISFEYDKKTGEITGFTENGEHFSRMPGKDHDTFVGEKSNEKRQNVSVDGDGNFSYTEGHHHHKRDEITTVRKWINGVDEKMTTVGMPGKFIEAGKNDSVIEKDGDGAHSRVIATTSHDKSQHREFKYGGIVGPDLQQFTENGVIWSKDAKGDFVRAGSNPPDKRTEVSVDSKTGTLSYANAKGEHIKEFADGDKLVELPNRGILTDPEGHVKYTYVNKDGHQMIHTFQYDKGVMTGFQENGEHWSRQADGKYSKDGSKPPETRSDVHVDAKTGVFSYKKIVRAEEHTVQVND